MSSIGAIKCANRWWWGSSGLSMANKTELHNKWESNWINFLPYMDVRLIKFIHNRILSAVIHIASSSCSPLVYIGNNPTIFLQHCCSLPCSHEQVLLFYQSHFGNFPHLFYQMLRRENKFFKWTLFLFFAILFFSFLKSNRSGNPSQMYWYRSDIERTGNVCRNMIRE